ncbi:hypothetical protein MRX96_032248 [Rhipicephalus microplus]
MEVTVNGTDADPAELESSDWVTKVSKCGAELQESQQRERDGATRMASTSGGCEKESRTVPALYNGDKNCVSRRLSYKAVGKKSRGAVGSVTLTASSEPGPQGYYQAQRRIDAH